MKIALCELPDREAVIGLLVEQMREHRVQADRAKLGAVFDELLADSRYGFILVAKDTGGVVGVAYVTIILSVEHGGRIGWMEELYVSPANRTRGIGTKLLQAVLDRAREIGFAAIDLEVDVEHQRAESLYRRFGFHDLPRKRWVKQLA